MALLAARRGLDADTLAQLPDEQLQCLLDGHPKAIVNKGRIGWGAWEYARYGTESGAAVRPVWLAVKARLAVHSRSGDWNWQELLAQSLDDGESERLTATCLSLGISWGEYLPLPVHPWQWHRYVRHQYAAMIARGDIRLLGEFGDEYLPQVSLRTLSNLQRPSALHLKLPLTVLNTSCYRGIPGRYMECGPALSEWVQGLCEHDPQMASRGTGVMREVAGIHLPHPHHEQVMGTPYRYRELLGVTWRESARAKCAAGERSLLMASLLQCDEDGRSVVAALIDSSGLEARQWLQQLFEKVVIPLYHLLCRYGVGLVAHAQNLTLIVNDAVVKRVLLKDFQGDLRLAEGNFPERDSLPDSAGRALARLPATHLLHDLYTGHFVTVLRYLSAQLEQEIALPERDFYRLLAGVLRNYQEEARRQWPGMRERFSHFDLFRPDMERVCINRVRLQQGYDDTHERPVPVLGTPLQNPLWLVEQENVDHGLQ
nr:IucA/IucC family protein [Microbulbifer sediminum]